MKGVLLARLAYRFIGYLSEKGSLNDATEISVLSSICQRLEKKKLLSGRNIAHSKIELTLWG